MATVTVKLRTDKKADDSGKYPLAIRVYHKKSFYFFFPFRLSEEDWNADTGKVKATHHQYAILNDAIRDRLEEIEEIVIKQTIRNSDVSPERLRRVIEQNTDKRNTDFLAYYNDYIETLKAEGSYSYSKSHLTAWNRLDEYCGGSLAFDEIDVRFLKRLKTYFLSDKGMAQNTLKSYFGRYQVVYNNAVKEGVIEQGNNPFYIVEFKSEKVKKTHLNISQINAINSLDLKPGTLRWKVQKAFMFSFWTAGMRISDICLIRWSNIRNWSEDIPSIDYTMKKNKKNIVLPILPPARKLLDDLKPKVMDIDMMNKRIFGFVDDRKLSEEEKYKKIKIADFKANRSLSVIADRAGITENLTFHVARHSFSACYEELDMPVEILQSLLAHSNLSTTENYRASFGSKRNMKALNQFHEKFKEVSDG